MKQIVSVNLTTEPVIKTDKKGFQYASFGAAEDLKKKTDAGFEKNGTRYYKVTAYGKRAMEIATGMHKGDRIEMSGEANLGVGEKKINFFKLKDAKIIFSKATAQAA